MSNYTKSTNFAVKDGLSVGTAAKRVRGTEIDDEFNAIATAVGTKADTNNGSLTGTPTAPTATAGTSSTQLATTAFVQGIKSSTALTGVPTAPTAAAGTSTTQIATTAFASSAASVVLDGTAVTGSKIYVDTDAATGGNNGDIWFEY